MSSNSSTKKNCMNDEEDLELRRGPWTLEEDNLLMHYIAFHGEGRWDMLAKCSGLKRTGKSCRLRWLNYLKPDVKRGNLTLEEQILILELHSKWGNRWSRIAQNLPGRTDNEIKNYWRTRVQKQARQLKIDANSKKFQDAVRSFWMPRLLQKMEESSRSSSSSPSSSCPSMKGQSPSPSPLVHNQSSQVSFPSQAPTLAPTQLMGCFNDQDYNTRMQNCTSPSTSSPDSMEILQFHEMSGYPISPNAFGNTFYNPIQKNCYQIDSNNNNNNSNSNNNYYGMEGFNNMNPMLALENSMSDCAVGESHWMMNNEEGLWNMDDLWELRKIQEKGI
ncbi:hypothetical protein Syun_021791 [Stephania yunnanensis]|uniref:Uncharacterized protein n=1 Tax=Stephania yunnanensis TaxID=152371 RepID=A0AAP0IG93_9MAGN